MVTIKLEFLCGHEYQDIIVTTWYAYWSLYWGFMVKARGNLVATIKIELLSQRERNFYVTAKTAR